jgi:hypothetical protein
MKKVISTERTPKYPLRVSQFLRAIPSQEVVSSLYYTGRLLQRRRDVADIRQGFRVAGVQGEPSDEDEKIAFQLLDRIEQAERRPVRLLSDRQADRYIRRFSKIIEQQARAKYGY